MVFSAYNFLCRQAKQFFHVAERSVTDSHWNSVKLKDCFMAIVRIAADVATKIEQLCIFWATEWSESFKPQLIQI